MPIHWCGFKTACVLDPGKLDEKIVDETIFDFMDTLKLPKNWKFRGHGIPGAAGFYLEFEIDGFPSQEECAQVEGLLNSLN